MTEDDIKTLEPLMLASLARTIDFVKFGEAKNAALLTFTSAWILASANVAIGEVAQDHFAVRIGLQFGVPLLGFAAFLALVSFLPRTDLKALKGHWNPNPKNNYLYFGHLGDFASDELHLRLASRFLTIGQSGLNQDYLDDLGCQIVVNAKIASTKFMLFGWGVRITILALFIYAVAAIMAVALP